MPYYLFTFRPQISEQDLFENFLTIFLPELKKCNNYAYTIENDNSIQKHIHVIQESKAKDLHNFKQLFNKKIFKDFKSSLKVKQTNEYGFDDRKVGEDETDFLKVLGYVMKEPQALRRGTTFPLSKIDEAITYYFTCKHIEKEATINNDYTLLTPKNCHVHICNWCKDHDMNPTDPMTILLMKKEKYCFTHLPKLQELQRECEIQLYPDRFQELEDKKTYNQLESIQIDNFQEIKELRKQVNALKKHFNLQNVEHHFGSIRIRHKGSDMDWIELD